MENSLLNPMSQLPQLLKALLQRLEENLLNQKENDIKNHTKELINKLKKESKTLENIISSSEGEHLTEEQQKEIKKVSPVAPDIFKMAGKKEK